MFVLGKHDPISRADGQWQRRLINVKAVAEAGFWVAWGLPTQGSPTRSHSSTPGSATASPRRPTCTSKRSERPASTRSRCVARHIKTSGKSLQDRNHSDRCCSWDVCPFCYEHHLTSI